jgi:hypothetical protein
VSAEVRREPDGQRVAIRTGPKITVAPWFVFDPDHGGGYTDGTREGVDRWPVMT